MLAELRRRNVFRAGLAWLALSWLLVALADLLFPALALPTAAIRGLVYGLLAALPLVLWLAWRYELTPQGVRVDRGPAHATAENARTGRRLDQLTIALVLLALALGALRQFALPERGEPPARPPAAAPVAPPAPAPFAEALPPAPPGPVDPRSLAVLAFTNLSPDPADAFLAEGVAEEILNALARVDGLKVASRTSSFAFRENTPGAREIGRRLGVAHVLEGSVRKSGSRVRITTQLIDADGDRHLWSESHDRELDDIFRLQEDIAQAVVDALAAPLGVRTVQVRRATDDLVAYELYLRGRQLFALRGANLGPARELLQQAVTRDPRFAEAWAALAGVDYVLPSYSAVRPVESSARAGEAADRALALLADLPDALAVRSRLAADAGRRGDAVTLIEQALASDPNNANAWTWKGLTMLEAGHLAAARSAFERARALDPLSGIHYGWLGAIKLIQGEADAAREHLQQAHALGWRGPASAWLLKLALGENDPAAAERYADWLHDDARISAERRAVHREVGAALADPAARDAARARLARAVAQWPDEDWTMLMLFLGLTDEAIAEALRPKPASGQVLLMMVWAPVDRPFREHPGFLELAGRAGLLDFWAAHGPPDACRLVEGPAPRLECDR